MDNESYIGFLALHSHTIVEVLAKVLNVSKRKAIDIFYNSDFYRLYERENTKLWHFSSITLADLLYQEIMTGTIEFPVEG